MSQSRMSEFIGQWTDKGAMSFNDFLRLYAVMHQKYDSVDDIREVFRLLANEAGVIPVRRLRAVIASLEPALSTQHVTSIIMSAFPEQEQTFRQFHMDGTVSFDKFCTIMRSLD